MSIKYKQLYHILNYGQQLSCVGRNGCVICYKKRLALFSQIVIQLKFCLAHKHFSNMVHRQSGDGPTGIPKFVVRWGALCPGEAL